MPFKFLATVKKPPTPKTAYIVIVDGIPTVNGVEIAGLKYVTTNGSIDAPLEVTITALARYPKKNKVPTV